MGSFCWSFMTLRCLRRGASLIAVQYKQNFMGISGCPGCHQWRAFHNAEAPDSWGSKLSANSQSSTKRVNLLCYIYCRVAGMWVYFNDLPIRRKASPGINTWNLYLPCCKGMGLFFTLWDNRWHPSLCVITDALLFYLKWELCVGEDRFHLLWFKSCDYWTFFHHHLLLNDNKALRVPISESKADVSYTS